MAEPLLGAARVAEAVDDPVARLGEAAGLLQNVSMNVKTSARAVARSGHTRVPLSSLSTARKLSAAALMPLDVERRFGLVPCGLPQGVQGR
ncbi:hypothetical protein WJ438_37035 [Streptomyces sp. GD-15H]|uniref:hypothetical protein n=1 Tax=Streptomyces sp. GD-15H TaxID=3129112 RepID=UPI0032564C68